MLKETGTLESKPIDILMGPIHFDQNLAELLAHFVKYRRLIGKLIYSAVTQLSITFTVCVKSIYAEPVSALLNCSLSYIVVC